MASSSVISPAYTFISFVTHLCLHTGHSCPHGDERRDARHDLHIVIRQPGQKAQEASGVSIHIGHVRSGSLHSVSVRSIHSVSVVIEMPVRSMTGKSSVAMMISFLDVVHCKNKQRVFLYPGVREKIVSIFWISVNVMLERKK